MFSCREPSEVRRSPSVQRLTVLQESQAAIQRQYDADRKTLEVSVRRAELVARPRLDRSQIDEQMALQNERHKKELQELETRLQTAFRQLDAVQLQRICAEEETTCTCDWTR